MYIATSSDVTLHSQVIEMVKGSMLVWIAVGSELLSVVYGIQSQELSLRGLIVGFVFRFSPFELVRVWFTPDTRRTNIVRHRRSEGAVKKIHV